LVAQRAGDEGRDASRLLSTFRVLAVLEGQPVPDQRIWEAADINKATWKAYEDLLQRTYISGAIRPLESNRLKRLTSYPKRFLIDAALALSLVGLDDSDLDADRSLAGRYLESFVAQQLRPQVGLVGGELWHLRTGAGQQEIDFVVETGDGLYALEVKASPSSGPAEAKHVRWFREKVGDRLIAGYLLHTGADTYPVDDNIWAVPITDLC
jgi:predicted AAA+ superfamily ATPase